MALLSEALKEKQFDVRMVERSLNKGLMLQSEADKHSSSLKDEQDHAGSIDLEVLRDEVVRNSKLRSTLHN